MRGTSLTIAGVYAIVDLPYAHPIAIEAIATALIDGGVRTIQLRAKHATRDQRRAWILAAARPCLQAGVPLIINDDLELAESGIDGLAGVHLGQGDLLALGADLDQRTRRRDRLRERGIALGVSTHSRDQVRQAIAELAPDYLGFGPVFATTTKLDPDPVVGIDRLARVCGEASIPIVAIGGVNSTRAIELASTGVTAIAAIGALVGASPDVIRARTAELVQAFGTGH